MVTSRSPKSFPSKSLPSKSLPSKGLPSKSLSPKMLDFDWQQLRQLAGEDTVFEVELLAMFLEDAESSLKALDHAIASCSIQTVEEIAHSLRGASANVGASDLALVARQLEQVARNGQIAEAPHLLQQIHAHCQQIQGHLESRL